MKLISAGNNSYINGDYVVDMEVVEHGNKFAIRINFLFGAYSIMHPFNTQDEAVKRMHKFAEQLNEEN